MRKNIAGKINFMIGNNFAFWKKALNFKRDGLEHAIYLLMGKKCKVCILSLIRDYKIDL